MSSIQWLNMFCKQRQESSGGWEAFVSTEATLMQLTVGPLMFTVSDWLLSSQQNACAVFSLIFLTLKLAVESSKLSVLIQLDRHSSNVLIFSYRRKVLFQVSVPPTLPISLCIRVLLRSHFLFTRRDFREIYLQSQKHAKKQSKYVLSNITFSALKTRLT